MAYPFIESVAFALVDTVATTITITKPSGTVSGDLLLAFIIKDDDDDITDIPSGWSEVDGGTAGATVNVRCYKKIAGGSEPDDYTWAGDSEDWAGIIFRISGHDDVNIADATAAEAATSATCPDVTTTSDECLVFRVIGRNGANVHGGNHGIQNFVVQGGFALACSGDVQIFGSVQWQASAGATGTVAVDFLHANASQASVSFTVAVAPKVLGSSGGPVGAAYFG